VKNSKKALKTIGLLALFYQLSTPPLAIGQCYVDILKLYEEYKDACYKDSTVVEYEMYVVNNDTVYCQTKSIDPAFYSGYIGKRKVWVHKKPTFEGFMEFLENKLKRKGKS